ncbi:MAG: DEAD/DEAH box helicase [Victivallales bacterium]|nr:DEAD/DEAH box helicase [Victivallales bacterium]
MISNLLRRIRRRSVEPFVPPDHSAREKSQKIEIVRGGEAKVHGTTSPKSPGQHSRRQKKSTQLKRHPSQREETGRAKHVPPPHEHIPTTPVNIPEITPPPPVDGKTRFSDFPLEPPILAACQELGFKYCTPVQEKSLPHLLNGLDLTGKAQTGTGKTAAFLITAINRFLRNPQKSPVPGTCRTLVLAPTRELAIQIHKDAQELSMFAGLRNLAVFGGMDHARQRAQLQHPLDIVVGTPGRIIDFSRSNDLKLNKVEILVIDEADRMLDMGFIPDVRRIVGKLPPAGERQTMFFSATFDTKILRLVSSWLVNPVSVEAEADNIVSNLIDQTFFSVTREDKLKLLRWILKNDNVERMLVFVNRKDIANSLVSTLKRQDIACSLLSGDVPQKQRISILESFRKGNTRVIVATDVAARGIHVEDVSHVVNYDLPYEPEDYVHRIGRTGRAGKKGKSISFLCEYGSFVIPELEKILGHPIRSVQPDEGMLLH